MSSRPSHIRRNLALLVVGLVLLVFGTWLGGHATWLPSPLSSGVVRDPQARLVHQVLDDIHADYFRKVNASQLTNSAVAAMIASLHDPFSHYFTPVEYSSLFSVSHVDGIGVAVNPVRRIVRGLEVENVYAGYPAAKAGLQPGDLITKVGSTSLIGRSTTFAQKLIRGNPGTYVVLTFLSGGRSHVVRIRRAHVTIPVASDRTYTYHGIKLGYVQLTTFEQSGAGDQVRADVEQVLHQGAKGIILDLRENGGGLINEAIKTASIFIPSGTIVSIHGRNTPRQVFTATGGAISPNIPVVVLVDGETASASEIVTAALQDYHRAKVVGTHTFGKGVFQDSFGLTGGGVLEIVAGYYYTPNGRNLGGGGVKQGAGVKPNIYVAENPHSRVDNQLQVALKTLAAEVK